MSAGFIRTDRTIAGSTIRILAHGDSITLGTTGTTTPYLPIVAASVLSGKAITADYRNCGVDGNGWNYAYTSNPPTVQNLTQGAYENVDRYLSATLTNYLICFAGTNDIHLNSKTGAQAYAYFQTYIAARIAAGWPAANICVCAMLPRQGIKETERGDYNTALVGGASTYGYKLARLDQNANIGLAGCDADTTYFNTDRIHPKNAGQTVIAATIYAAMFP